jgi:hypothetical protein
MTTKIPDQESEAISERQVYEDDLQAKLAHEMAKKGVHDVTHG